MDHRGCCGEMGAALEGWRSVVMLIRVRIRDRAPGHGYPLGDFHKNQTDLPSRGYDVDFPAGSRRTRRNPDGTMANRRPVDSVVAIEERGVPNETRTSSQMDEEGVWCYTCLRYRVRLGTGRLLSPVDVQCNTMGNDTHGGKTVSRYAWKRGSRSQIFPVPPWLFPSPRPPPSAPDMGPIKFLECGSPLTSCEPPLRNEKVSGMCVSACWSREAGTGRTCTRRSGCTR